MLIALALSLALLGEQPETVMITLHAKPGAEQALARIAAPDVAFRDRYSSIEGIDDLHAHIGAALRFMPGVRLLRTGGVRQCQGTALTDWTAAGPEGRVAATGTSVFVFDADARITSVIGLWN